MTNEHFRGSRQYYQKQYAACMTICREIGSIDLLITYTMDPSAPELSNILLEHQNWSDRPMEVCRIFIDKLAELVKDITEREVLGPVKAWFHSLEHQKRGLPHVHFAVILDWEKMRTSGRITTKEEYMEQYISAEIPDLPNSMDRTESAQSQRLLHQIVVTKHVHTCNQHCQRDGVRCAKRFPHAYSDDNIYSDNAYPKYRRRPPPTSENERKKNPELFGNTHKYVDRYGKQHVVTNQYVVPYNHYLLSKYRSHINVELVAGDGCVKYVTKYVMKGADMAFIRVEQEGIEGGAWRYDEFHQLRLARYITSMEAFLSLWGTKLVVRSHIVDELDIHGPQGHHVAVEEGRELEIAENLQRRLNEGEERRTQLTAYFDFNRQRQLIGEQPAGLTYGNAYKQLRYNIHKKNWQISVYKHHKKLCRIRTVSPTNLELLAIRILLTVVVDPTSWEHLRTFENVAYPTFLDAAKARGLMSDDVIWRRTIQEAFDSNKRVQQRIRWLAMFFGSTNLTNPTALLDYVIQLPEDWLYGTRVAQLDFEARRDYVLCNMEWFLRANGIRPDEIERDDGTFETACERIRLPRPSLRNIQPELLNDAEIDPEMMIRTHVDKPFLEEHQRGSTQDYYLRLFYNDPRPTEEQQQFIDEIVRGMWSARHVIDGLETSFAQDIPRYFFITGEGGSGKTFMYNKLIAFLHANEFLIMPMASTGIAAELLYGGATVHKRLCRQKHVDSSTKPFVDYRSQFADTLRKLHGIIIDEISMQHKDVLEFVDRLFRSIAPRTLKQIPFGGKCVILGGDWKQLLPVVAGGTLLHQFDASIKNTVLFKNFVTRKLRSNLRLLHGQEQYRTFLKCVGTGVLNDSDERVQLPVGICVNSREELINFVYPQDLLQTAIHRWEEFCGRAILCPLNTETFEMNNIILVVS
uniref:ATP-dependent DNA helicase n=3 Tax=Meloidogyne TaxID=189290 RepID=A0A914M1P1_MELIC